MLVLLLLGDCWLHLLLNLARRLLQQMLHVGRGSVIDVLLLVLVLELCDHWLLHHLAILILRVLLS